jgi:hypothetical protein
MYWQQLSQLVMGAVFLAVLSVGCDAPASMPTPVPSTAMAGRPTGTATADFTPVDSIGDIVGTWRSSSRDLYLRFDESGILRKSFSVDKLDSRPYSTNEVWFEGTQMYLKEMAVSGAPSCGDEAAVYEVRLYSEGGIRIVKIRDSCAPRVRHTALELDPVP